MGICLCVGGLSGCLSGVALVLSCPVLALLPWSVLVWKMGPPWLIHGGSPSSAPPFCVLPVCLRIDVCTIGIEVPITDYIPIYLPTCMYPVLVIHDWWMFD